MKLLWNSFFQSSIKNLQKEPQHMRLNVRIETVLYFNFLWTIILIREFFSLEHTLVLFYDFYYNQIEKDILRYIEACDF